MKNILIKTVGVAKKHLVMFHGWGFNHTIWLDWCELLRSDFTCHLVDLPGFGLSQYMTDKEWFKKLHEYLPKPFTLLGWSLGGLYAIRYAEQYPDDIDDLHLLATSPYFIKDTNWPGIEYDAFREFQRQLIKDPQKTLDGFINLHSKGAIPQSWQYMPPNIEALQAGVEALITWDLRANLKKLAHKTSLTLGRLDKIISAELATSIKNYYPKIITTVLSKTGHMPFLTHADLLRNIILECV